MIKKILIANRGEIACRVSRACRELGIASVAVYSEADESALHTALADFSIAIGPAPVKQSYLDRKAILRAAIECGADAIHPGYGLLSEDSAFASDVIRAGLKWIGPSPETMKAMGDKARARQVALDSNVPVLPGSERLTPDLMANLESVAQSVGFPLLVKAVGGGGGIGMKLVEDVTKLRATVEMAQSMAQKSFSSAEVYLERFVPRAKHIEIQLFGYGDGTAIHLFERDCSTQRRYQKIVEESPAPGVPPSVLARMTDAAVALASRQKYAGAGTVEFIVDARTHEFFFLEMNTRIQVEHAVTETVTGVDLVQLQILLAAGSPKRISQSEVQTSGHSIECRIYAENPAKHFIPSPGLLRRLRFPDGSSCLRIDTGMREGDTVSSFYDPMIAKVIVRGSSRSEAIRKMANALRDVEIAGPSTNLPFLRTLIAHPAFQSGDVDTGFVDRNRNELTQIGTQTTEALQ